MTQAFGDIAGELGVNSAYRLRKKPPQSGTLFTSLPSQQHISERVISRVGHCYIL
jgi:hypothetical protein